MVTYYKPKEVTEIKSIKHLLDEVKKYRDSHKDRAVYLRGNAEEHWRLVPSIGRRKVYRYGNETIKQFTLEQERGLFHRFRNAMRHSNSLAVVGNTFEN